MPLQAKNTSGCACIRQVVEGKEWEMGGGGGMQEGRRWERRWARERGEEHCMS